MNHDFREMPGILAMNPEAGAQLPGRKRQLFFVLALFCVAVPGFATVKALLILLTWSFIALTSEVHLRAVGWYLSVLLSLAFCGEIALLNGVSISDFANHLSRFLLFFLVLGLGASMAASGGFDAKSTDRLILAIAVLSIVLKIGILTLVFTGEASFDSVQSALGFESVTDSIGFGIQRLQFPSDIILVFLLSCYSGRRRVMDLVFLICVTVSIFLSFSRYLFVAYALCLMIRFLRIRKLDLISGAAIAFAVLLIAVFSVSLSSRFEGEGTRVSDDTRTEQIRYLSASILERPIFGSGIGSSVNGYKRSDTIPFSYEVQWYAMAMQLGILGLSWFLLNLIAPLVGVVRSRRGCIVSFCLFSVWVAGGFTNPFMISLGSSFGFCILMFTVANDDGRKQVSLPLGLPQLQS